MKTIASETDSLGLKLFKTLETKRELSYSKHPVSPIVVPVGAKVDVYWAEKNPSRVYFEYGGHIRACLTAKMKDTFYGKFTKMPTARTLEKWEWEGGYCLTVTGHKTEPDGYGPDGSPSWMLVAGII